MKLISVLFLVLAYSAFSFAQGSAKDDTALKAVVHQLIDAQIAYDVKKLDSLFTADYIEISPLGEFDPRDKVLGFYAPDKKPPIEIKVSVEGSEYSIRSFGEYAIVIVRLDYIMSSGDKFLPPRSIRAMYVMKKAKDSWKIASAQYTGIRPPQPPK